MNKPTEEKIEAAARAIQELYADAGSVSSGLTYKLQAKVALEAAAKVRGE